MSDAQDALAIHAELVQMCDTLHRWDLLVGRLALIIKMHGLWRDMQFTSFSHYCTERLGVSTRAVEQRAWLERQLFFVEGLREALESRRLSYSKALIVARSKGAISIEDAEGRTCLDLQHQLDDLEREQMRKNASLDLQLPEDVVDRLDEAVRAIRHAARAAGERWLPPGEALYRLAVHCRDLWKHELPPLLGQRWRLHERKRGLCESPGCSATGKDRHHVLFKSHGGEGDDNKVLLCRPHHHRGVHKGRMRIFARDDGSFEWHLGVRPGRAPLEIRVTRPEGGA